MTLRPLVPRRRRGWRWSGTCPPPRRPRKPSPLARDAQVSSWRLVRRTRNGSAAGSPDRQSDTIRACSGAVAFRPGPVAGASTSRLHLVAGAHARDVERLQGSGQEHRHHDTGEDSQSEVESLARTDERGAGRQRDDVIVGRLEREERPAAAAVADSSECSSETGCPPARARASRASTFARIAVIDVVSRICS